MAKKGNRNYKRGREFEYKTRDYLYEMGAVYVMRAAQSKGAADLIALFQGRLQGDGVSGTGASIPDVWVVQCKRDGKLPAAEREELLRIAHTTGATAAHAYQGPRGTPVVIDEIGEAS